MLTINARRVAALALALALLWLAACDSTPDPQGEAMFYGRASLIGRIPGDATPLPPIATRCVNCHEKDNVSPLTGVGGKSYAPRLGKAWLSETRSRRGGPASSYDEAAFCTLLRIGVDPARIIISTIMPRYELSDASCHSLWRYVESR